MISVSELSMRYGEKVLFEKVSVKFRPGNRYGLIGANGSGKSTFMKILAGELEASTGDIAIDSGCTLGYLKQDHYQYEHHAILDVVYMGNEKLWALHQEREMLYAKADMTDKESVRMGEVEDEFGQAGGYTMETDAAKLLIGLGIEEKLHTEHLSTLTGGFKLRVLLAQALFGKPDILLLDEPTNHLDMASIDWLEDFLSVYKGTVIVISHDRFFINRVCTHIADLDYQEVRMFTGNYDEFMIANEQALEKTRRENAQKQKRIDDLNDFINRFSANASKAKQATSRQKELSKIEMQEIKPSSRVSPYIRFNPKTRLGEKVIEVENISKSYDKTLFSNYSGLFKNGERVGIIGTNGAGKTTFLKILAGELAPDTGKVIRGETVEIDVFPQDAKEVLNSTEPAINWLSHVPTTVGMGETELRSAMGRMLFRGDAVFKPVNVLSGGEKARLILAAMMLAQKNLLMFDEPTNHLDLEAIEALNFSLGLVKETLFFVSHDREFVRSLATRIIEIGDGRITDYPGTLDEYDAHKAAEKKKQRV